MENKTSSPEFKAPGRAEKGIDPNSYYIHFMFYFGWTLCLVVLHITSISKSRD